MSTHANAPLTIPDLAHFLGTALAIAAGVALVVFGGPVGIGAAIAIGAAMGTGSNLVDQLCTGYPVDWKRVGLSGALG